MNLTEFSRLGGNARTRALTAAQRKASASAAARAYWARMSPAKRSAELRRRAKVRSATHRCQTCGNPASIETRTPLGESAGWYCAACYRDAITSRRATNRLDQSTSGTVKQSVEPGMK